MPSDADYCAMALGRNPELYTPEQQAQMRKVIDEEIAEERALMDRLRQKQQEKAAEQK